MSLAFIFNSFYIYIEITKNYGGIIMSTNKRQFTLRFDDETYERARYLAYMERRSISMEIEHMINSYADNYEKEHGPIPLPAPSES